MSTASGMGACKNCEAQLKSDGTCPECPKDDVEARPRPLALVKSSPQSAAASEDATARFRKVLEEMQQARQSGHRVIINIGLSEAGKSWLIARIGEANKGVYDATLYSASGEAELSNLGSGQRLPRTSIDQAYVWNLTPGEGGRDQISGRWKVVDIAGEMVTDLSFIAKIVAGSPLHDLLLMTLAEASAIVIVIDGKDVARLLTGKADEVGGSLDQRYAKIINELVRLHQFIESRQGRRLMAAEHLADLKEAIKNNPSLQLKDPSSWLRVPVALVISKADMVARLEPGSQSPLDAKDLDALRFAEAHFPKTQAKAASTVAAFRWAFVAPFVGQPDGQDKKISELLDFGRKSYGIRELMRWLDAEMERPPGGDGLTASDALSDWRRWLPSWSLRGSRS